MLPSDDRHHHLQGNKKPFRKKFSSRPPSVPILLSHGAKASAEPSCGRNQSVVSGNGGEPRASRLGAGAGEATHRHRSTVSSAHSAQLGTAIASASISRYAARGTSTAPSEARCGVVHCTSSSVAPVADAASPTRATRATFEASVASGTSTRRRTARRCGRRTGRPTSRSSRYASTLCAQPSRAARRRRRRTAA